MELPSIFSSHTTSTMRPNASSTRSSHASSSPPFVHGVVQRVHAAFVADGGELLAHVAAHALGRRVGVVELRMRRLQRAQLVHQRIERGIRDGGASLA